MLGQVMSGYSRLVYVKKGYVRLGRLVLVWSGDSKCVQVRPS
jgi:hypothetical protein